MEPIIRIDRVGKEYQFGETLPYGSLRESISRLGGTPVRRLRQLLNGRSPAVRPSPPTMWALRDVSLDVRPGEVVGIIGRNGAGKSTLLKILSRITHPTTGRVELFGRVASLLEVGTGFHPELTGRENIAVNSAILGMSAREAAARFDEIVEFAGVEPFLDTPLKRYSTGMQVRLGFAIAAHLEPDILIVDEVLAVGDADFQKKCLNKMEGVSRAGRTVLFVSHNMQAVTRLCPRAVLLDHGRLIHDGPSHEAVGLYLRSDTGSVAAREWHDPATAPGNEVVRLRAVRVRTDAGRVSEAMDIRKPVGIEMEFDVLQPGHVLVPNYQVLNDAGIHVFWAADHDPAWLRRPRPTGRYRSTAWLPGNLLAEGSLYVGAAVSTMAPSRVHFWEPDAVAFQVVDSAEGDSARGDYGGPLPGVIRPLLNWTTSYSAVAGADESPPVHRA